MAAPTTPPRCPSGYVSTREVDSYKHRQPLYGDRRFHPPGLSTRTCRHTEGGKYSRTHTPASSGIINLAGGCNIPESIGPIFRSASSSPLAGKNNGGCRSGTSMTYSAKYEMIKVLRSLGKNWDTSCCVYGHNGTFGYFLDYPSADSSCTRNTLPRGDTFRAHYVKTEERITTLHS